MSAGPGADFHPSRHPIETFPFLLLDRSFFLCRLAGRGWSFLPVFCCSLYCWLNKSPGGRSAVESRCGFARLRRGACRSWNGVASQYNGALQEEEKQKLVQPLFFCACVFVCVAVVCRRSCCFVIFAVAAAATVFFLCAPLDFFLPGRHCVTGPTFLTLSTSAQSFVSLYHRTVCQQSPFRHWHTRTQKENATFNDRFSEISHRTRVPFAQSSDQIFFIFSMFPDIVDTTDATDFVRFGSKSLSEYKYLIESGSYQ